MSQINRNLFVKKLLFSGFWFSWTTSVLAELPDKNPETGQFDKEQLSEQPPIEVDHIEDMRGVFLFPTKISHIFRENLSFTISWSEVEQNCLQLLEQEQEKRKPFYGGTTLLNYYGPDYKIYLRFRRQDLPGNRYRFIPLFYTTVRIVQEVKEIQSRVSNPATLLIEATVGAIDEKNGGRSKQYGILVFDKTPVIKPTIHFTPTPTFVKKVDFFEKDPGFFNWSFRWTLEIEPEAEEAFLKEVFDTKNIF